MKVDALVSEHKVVEIDDGEIRSIVETVIHHIYGFPPVSDSLYESLKIKNGDLVFYRDKGVPDTWLVPEIVRPATPSDIEGIAVIHRLMTANISGLK